MKLNCKPGDLAVVCYPKSSYDGFIVRCVAWVGGAYDYWQIDRLLPEQYSPMMADCILRPIRDNDGEDETLQWLEVPRKVAA